MRFTKTIAYSLVFISAGLGLNRQSAEANLVYYADILGTSVSFSDICESSTNPGPIYGQPLAFGDMALSPGTGFLSQSNGGQINLVDGRLQMTISADPGFLIDSISVNQLGSFLGFGDQATVLANGVATVVSAGGNFSGSLFYSHTGDGSGSWGENATLHFPATNTVAFTLDHQLLTAAGLDSASFIDTSSIQISVSGVAAAIPEPGTIRFLSLAAVATGVCLVRRRKSPSESGITKT